MHLSRRNVLAACLGAAAVSALPRIGPAWAGTPVKPKNLILVLATGGWDPVYAFDPKPGLSTIDAPAGTIRHFGDLPVFVDDSRPARVSRSRSSLPFCSTSSASSRRASSRSVLKFPRVKKLSSARSTLSSA